MAKLPVTIQVRQKLYDKILFKSLLCLGSIGFISLDKAIRIVNKRLNKGAFKYRTGKGKWCKLKTEHEIVVE